MAKSLHLQVRSSPKLGASLIRAEAKNECKNLRINELRQVSLERDINIAVHGCFGFATSTRKGPLMAMLISHSTGTYLIT